MIPSTRQPKQSATVSAATGHGLIRRVRTPEQETIRFLGIPVKTTRFSAYQRTIYLCGIRVAKRIDPALFERSVHHMLDRINALHDQEQSSRADEPPRMTPTERAAALPSYGLMCQARDGQLRLEDELKIVTRQVVSLMNAQQSNDA
jgi:hypothetical protein